MLFQSVSPCYDRGMGKRVVVIGGGIGGLAVACLLGKGGYHVTVLEKNRQLGGRIGRLQVDGFTFDTGPSWYLMPEVFERFLAALGEDITDYIKLLRLQPSYRVFYKGTGKRLNITGDIGTDTVAFESIEKGAGDKLRRYLQKAEDRYNFAVEHLLYRDYHSPRDLLRWDLIRKAPTFGVFSSLHTQASRYFKDPRLQQIIEFPAVFLGASPYQAPAFYSLLNHTVFRQGVFYPKGGMYGIVEALVRIGKKYGVTYKTNCTAKAIVVRDGKAYAVHTGTKEYVADTVISDAGVYYTENELLEVPFRDHSTNYWQTRTFAPSALLLYIGVAKQFDSLAHHNLLFSKTWQQHFTDIFDRQAFPADPSIYICTPSKTDPSVAPAGHENLFVLVPLSTELQYNQAQLDAYADMVLTSMEEGMSLPNLRKHIVYKKLFCVDDFAKQLNSPYGTGLGLAHTLKQTAFFRPHSVSRKVKNLHYVGADVHPGIGLAPILISAELCYNRLTGGLSSRAS